MLLANFFDWTVQQHFPSAIYLKVLVVLPIHRLLRLPKMTGRTDTTNVVIVFLPCIIQCILSASLIFIKDPFKADVEILKEKLMACRKSHLLIYLTEFVAICPQMLDWFGLVFTLYPLDPDFLHWAVDVWQLVCWLQGFPTGMCVLKLF